MTGKQLTEMNFKMCYLTSMLFHKMLAVIWGYAIDTQCQFPFYFPVFYVCAWLCLSITYYHKAKNAVAGFDQIKPYTASDVPSKKTHLKLH